MKQELLNRIRQLQLLLSIVIFIGITAVSWFVTGFDITEIQISVWGSDGPTRWLWNGAIILISIAIWFNVMVWILHHKRLKYKIPFYILFTLLTGCLLMIGSFPTGQYQLLHDVPAVLYFFFYPMTIFFMAFVNRKEIQYQEWIRHLMFSVMMILIPLSLIAAFKGMAISEILHTLIVGFWNISLLIIDTHDTKE
jgi:hypothetical membrane protein